jgi:hypothetical protein
MDNPSSSELWFLSPPATGSGFLFIATHASSQIDDINRALIDNGFRLAVSLSDETSRYHVKNDCGVVYRSCLSEDNLPFIGGSIIPHLSKRKLVRRLAIPTFILGMGTIVTILLLAIVLLSVAIAALIGNISLASIIARDYSPLFLVLLLLVVPLAIFGVPLILIKRRYKRILLSLKTKVKTLLRDIFPDYKIHEVEKYYHLISKQVPKMLSTLIDQFSETIPDVTHDDFREFDLSEHSM